MLNFTWTAPFMCVPHIQNKESKKETNLTWVTVQKKDQKIFLSFKKRSYLLIPATLLLRIYVKETKCLCELISFIIFRMTQYWNNHRLQKQGPGKYITVHNGFSFILLANICCGSIRLGIQQAILSKTYIVLAVVYNINLWVTSLQINK